MELNQIKLSPELLQALYGRTLVLPETDISDKPEPIKQPVIAQQEAQIPQIPFLGGNKQAFLVLVHYPDLPFLPDESYAFLGNVLKACQLNAADIAIVNSAKQSHSLNNLSAQLTPRIILAFSETARPVEWPALKLFTPTRYKPLSGTDDIQLLELPALEILNQPGDAAKPLKKQLWESLKTILGIT